MNPLEIVHSWIQSLPTEKLPTTIPSAPRPSPNATNRKRSRRSIQEPSPPTTQFGSGNRKRPADRQSDADMSSITPTQKRQRKTPSAQTEETPRARLGNAVFLHDLQQKKPQSHRSSSPTKSQLASLRLHNEAVIEHLGPGDAPNEEAEKLLDRLQEIYGFSLGLFPASHRERILESAALKQTLTGRTRTLWERAFEDCPPSCLPGRIPSPEEIIAVVTSARQMDILDHEEAAWNLEVHSRLLSFVFRKEPYFVEANGHLNVTSCTSARPDARWLPKGAFAKLVDFCLFSTFTTADPALLEAQQQFCLAVDGKSINHTSFAPLQNHPIMLSIETKKPDAHAAKAQLQMLIWHSSQWKFLLHAIMTSRALRRIQTVGAEDAAATSVSGSGSELAEDEDMNHHDSADVGNRKRNMNLQQEEEAANEILSQLPFIPGILVSGHRWSLVLSTWGRRDGSTSKRRGFEFWREFQFGSTTDLLSTYRVVAGIRELAAWLEQCYQPWFTEHVLGVMPIDNTG